MINGYDRLEGVGENKMEQGFPLSPRTVGSTLQQLASEIEPHGKVPELPWEIKQLVLLDRLLFLPPFYELDQVPDLERTARMEILSWIDQPGVSAATRSSGIDTGVGDHPSTWLMTRCSPTLLFVRTMRK